MARGINKAILVGHLGKDPDTKYTQGGMAITRISVATSTSRKDKEGNVQERTDWHRVLLLGKLAEIAKEYLHKGSQVYIEGEIRYDKYTDKDGIEKYSTEILANKVELLCNNSREENRQPTSTYRQRPTNQQNTHQQKPSYQQNSQISDADFEDDDIPF